jgi:hypothetical protein
MKQVEAWKIHELLELVGTGCPVPKKLLERCSAAVERELAINRARGRRSGDFFSVRSTLEGAGEVVDGKTVARVAQALREDAAKRPDPPRWPTAADLRDLLAGVDALDDDTERGD